MKIRKTSFSITVPFLVFIIFWQLFPIERKSYASGISYYIALSSGSNAWDCGDDSNDGLYPDCSSGGGHGPKTINSFDEFTYSNLNAGDTLYIRAGTYVNPRSIIIKSGTETSPITIKNYNGEEVVFERGDEIIFGKTWGTTPPEQQQIQWWVIDGIIFDNPWYASGSMSTTAISFGAWRFASGSPIGWFKNITIKNCTFRNMVAGLVFHDAENIIIENNTFDNIRRRYSFLGEDGSGNIVEIDGREVEGVGLTYKANNVIIRNNTFTDIGSDGIQLGRYSPVGASAERKIYDIQILNNTIEVTRTGENDKNVYRNENGDEITTACPTDNFQACPAHAGESTGELCLRDWDTNHYCYFTSNVGENAIDIKHVGKIGENPIIVAGNTMSGFRAVDRDTQDASGSYGAAIDLHFDSRNIIIRSNRVTNSNTGLSISQGSSGTLWGMNDISVFNNVFSEMVSTGYTAYISGNFVEKTVTGFGLYLHTAHDLAIYNNTIVNTNNNTYSIYASGDDNIDFAGSSPILFKNNCVVGTNLIKSSNTWETGFIWTSDYNLWSAPATAPRKASGSHDVLTTNPLY